MRKCKNCVDNRADVNFLYCVKSQKRLKFGTILDFSGTIFA